MTREDIIEFGWDAGLNFDSFWSGQIGEIGINHLEIFAQLVAKDAYLAGLNSGIEAEREACAAAAEFFIVGSETARKSDDLAKAIACEIRARKETK